MRDVVLIWRWVIAVCLADVGLMVIRGARPGDNWQLLAEDRAIWVNPSDAEVTYVQGTKKQNNSENHLNPVMLVFIGKLSRSTVRWVPICQGFSHISAFCHHFLLIKLATSSERVYPFSSALHTGSDNFGKILRPKAYLKKKIFEGETFMKT